MYTVKLCLTHHLTVVVIVVAVAAAVSWMHLFGVAPHRITEWKVRECVCPWPHTYSVCLVADGRT